MAHMGWAVATPQECRCWKPLRGGGERLWKSRSVETQRQGSHCAWKSRKGRGIPTFPQPRRRVLYVELESGHITCYKNRTSSRANNTSLPLDSANGGLNAGLVLVHWASVSRAITHQAQQTTVLLLRKSIIGTIVRWDVQIEAGLFWSGSPKVKRKWISRLGDINKELLLILSIIAAAGIVNFFIAGQRLVLTFYNLPTLMAAYYFGRRRAVEAALASILFGIWMNPVNPTVFGGSVEWKTQGLLAWSDLGVWAGFLVISAYATGSPYELGERRLNELRDTYYGVLQILNQFVGNDKFTQNHSYRVSVYSTTIAAEMRLPEQQIEDVRAAALLHEIGKRVV